MSSNKKKQLLTERQTAAAKEAKKLKCYTVTFWVIIALVACIFIGAVSVNPIKNVLYKYTDSITVGEHTLSSVEANYFYVDAVNNYVQNNSLDKTKPLDEQKNPYIDGTWAQYFLNTIQDTIKSTYALYDLAMADPDFALSDDDKNAISSTISTQTFYAQYMYGYSSLDAYLRAIYGNGASEESYRNYLEVSAIASAYYNDYSESLEFSADDLNNYQLKAPYEYNAYTFASYYISHSKFPEYGTTTDGKTDFSDPQKAEAMKAAKSVADLLAAGTYETSADFDKAIKALDFNKDVTSAGSTKNEDVLYSSVNNLFKDWIAGRTLKEGVDKDATHDYDDYEITEQRKAGDLTVIESTNGYYVLRYEGSVTNDYALKNVRHVLVEFEGGTTENGTTTYTDEEKSKAKEKAEKLYNEWKDKGDLSEDSFAALAKESSKDTGSASDGGLCDDVYPGQMVQSFEDWCYDDNRQVGDTGIIESEYGYHIMFFVGNSQTTYRNYLIEEALHAETLQNWYDALLEKVTVTITSDRFIKTDMVLE